MLLNFIIIAITYYLFIYNLMKENPRIQMPNGSELSFSLDGSFRWMVVFFQVEVHDHRTIYRSIIYKQTIIIS